MESEESAYIKKRIPAATVFPLFEARQTSERPAMEKRGFLLRGYKRSLLCVCAAFFLLAIKALFNCRKKEPSSLSIFSSQNERCRQMNSIEGPAQPRSG